MSGFDLPPAYDSLKDIYDTLSDDAKKQLKMLASVTPSHSLRTKVIEAVHKKASDPKFKDDLVKEAELLGNTIQLLNKDLRGS